MTKWKIYRSSYWIGEIFMSIDEPKNKNLQEFLISPVSDEILYCLDNGIVLEKGTDFEFVDVGGKWMETTYDQPDRYEPNLQPVLTEKIMKTIHRDQKIGNLI
jgi:hypothetical protein